MTVRIHRLLDDVPRLTEGEAFEELQRCGNVRIERIVGSPSPPPTLYDQEQDEWVLLLRGEAVLSVEGQAVKLRQGDGVFLPAHTPHRVVSASRETPCVWLAIHIFRSPG